MADLLRLYYHPKQRKTRILMWQGVVVDDKKYKHIIDKIANSKPMSMCGNCQSKSIPFDNVVESCCICGKALCEQCGVRVSLGENNDDKIWQGIHKC